MEVRTDMLRWGFDCGWYPKVRLMLTSRCLQKASLMVMVLDY